MYNDDDFDHWHSIKKTLQAQTRLPTFNEREIWWCAVGVNLGSEVCGKGQQFRRPVLVLHKYNRYTFMGLPLTSTLKPDNPYFFELDFKDRTGSIMLNQARTFASKRLSSMMGKLPEHKFEEVQAAFLQCLHSKKKP